MAQEQEFPEEAFEGSEEEKLQLENELLKLKMQAELGAQFGAMPGMEIPPELERLFLEQVQAFHQQQAEHPPGPLRAYLGYPQFPPAAALTEAELEKEWERLNELYDEKGIGVDFLAEYPLALRYDFMAVEMMDKEVAAMPGWRFIYEEYYPNHDYDQRRRTEEFMEGFFEGSFTEFFMPAALITEDGREISLSEAQQLLERFHSLFKEIKDWDYQIHNTSAQSDEEMQGDIRLGFTEGLIKYTTVLADGSEQEIMGPFKLYFQCTYDWWQVMSFYMHGFSWK